MDAIFQQAGHMQRTLRVRSWPFWKLPRPLAAFVAAVILATLLQRSAVHGQLVKDARTDSKTGLLNAATWEPHPQPLPPRLGLLARGLRARRRGIRPLALLHIHAL